MSETQANGEALLAATTSALEKAEKALAAATSPRGGLAYKLAAKALAAVGAVGKDGYNQFHKYKFRSIDDVTNAVKPALADVGLGLRFEIVERHVSIVESERGTKQRLAEIRVKFWLTAEDGSEYLLADTWGEGADTADKSTNKALIAAFKYAVIVAFCIPTKDADDADSDSPDTTGRQHTQQNVNASNGRGAQRAPQTSAPSRPTPQSSLPSGASSQAAGPRTLSQEESAKLDGESPEMKLLTKLLGTTTTVDSKALRPEVDKLTGGNDGHWLHQRALEHHNELRAKERAAKAEAEKANGKDGVA